MTNTQTVVDAPHKDLRRARAAALSLIPTTTGSATAIGLIFPELQGQARTASRCACRCSTPRSPTASSRSRARRRSRRSTRCSQAAADGPLAGILGYEERPLVSVDYKDDPRSAIVDALSTMVVDGTQVKILAWYDNEWGYANRLVELARMVAAEPAARRSGADEPPRRDAATCATTRSSPAPTGPTRSPTARSACSCCFYFYELGYTPVRGRARCSSSTSSSASSPTSSAAGSPRASG